MEAERLKSLADVERSVAVRQNIGVAFITFDDASVASRFHICYTLMWYELTDKLFIKILADYFTHLSLTTVYK